MIDLFPADTSAEDVESLSQAAAEIAVSRGYVGTEGATYAFVLCSLLVNSLFLGNLPVEPPSGTRLRAV